MASQDFNVDCAKIRQLNSRFANTLVKIQKTFGDLKTKINEYFEQYLESKFINIIEELNIVSHKIIQLL